MDFQDPSLRTADIFSVITTAEKTGFSCRPSRPCEPIIKTPFWFALMQSVSSMFVNYHRYTEASINVQLSTRLGVSRSCLDCLQSLFFCKNTKIKCFALQADILDEGQIYLGGGGPTPRPPVQYK